MKSYCLEVSGDFACFTRPEMKVERVSYDVITPSAARAVFESIVWKPAIRWHVTKIEVLKPIKWVSIRRNEVGAVASTRNIQTAMNAGKGNLGMFIEDERQQRAGLFLRDVAYRIHAQFELRDPGFHKPNFPHLSKHRIISGEEDLAAMPDNNAVKFMSIFERRAARGQCVNQPYLGCREFACEFRLVGKPDAEPPPLDETRDFGFMFFDLNYSNATNPTPCFFRAQMERGVMQVPRWNSEEVRG